MVRTPSTMLALGTPAPSFTLQDPARQEAVTLEDRIGAAGVLVVFICNHCPYVLHLQEGLVNFARDYQERGISVIAINSNDVSTHPNDSPERMVTEARRAGYTFPYLFDETQEVAKAYRAACTPDFFLFDAERRLVYRGQFDESRPGNDTPVTGRDLREAADALLSGDPISEEQRASVGCNIKWKRGNEPEYGLR